MSVCNNVLSVSFSFSFIRLLKLFSLILVFCLCLSVLFLHFDRYASLLNFWFVLLSCLPGILYLLRICLYYGGKINEMNKTVLISICSIYLNSKEMQKRRRQLTWTEEVLKRLHFVGDPVPEIGHCWSPVMSSSPTSCLKTVGHCLPMETEAVVVLAAEENKINTFADIF